MTLPLKAIAVFDAVARCCSLSKAAEELYVTPSAVSQQIHSLELHLGTTLITKVGRGIALTEAGERYFEMIAENMQSITEATNRIRGLRTRSTLTVRTTPTLGSKWLLPRLHRFMEANPDIELRINGTTEITDFSRESVDVEIRHGEGKWPGVHIEGLAQENFFPVCAPSYRAAGSLQCADLQSHRLIYSVKAQLQWAHWFASLDIKTSLELSRLQFDRSHMAIDAAVDGLGVALESNLMMSHELKTGKLICPVDIPPNFKLTTQWIVCPYDHLRKSKVLRFLEWLRQERELWEHEIAQTKLQSPSTQCAPSL
ncbi:MAG: hypothetical protein RLZ63_557 [Pseudomonadota bacterium]|jgi:DNA-binding transcriptional LysR family regulator